MKNAKNTLLRNKKGVNDMSIATTWITILFFSSIFLTFVNAEFGTRASTFNTDLFDAQAVQDTDEVGSLNPVTILSTLLGLVTFGVTGGLILPFWLIGFYSIMTVMLIVWLARNFIPFLGGGS